MADRGDEKRSNPTQDDMVRGGGDEQIRGVANDEEDFEEAEDLDEEEDDNEEGSF
jgi:hypothetical protein